MATELREAALGALSWEPADEEKKKSVCEQATRRVAAGAAPAGFGQTRGSSRDCG